MKDLYAHTLLFVRAIESEGSSTNTSALMCDVVIKEWKRAVMDVINTSRGT